MTQITRSRSGLPLAALAATLAVGSASTALVVFFQLGAYRGSLVPAPRWDAIHWSLDATRSVICSAAVVFVPTISAVLAARARKRATVDAARAASKALAWLVVSLAPLLALLFAGLSLAQNDALLRFAVRATPWLVSLGLAGWLEGLIELAFGGAGESGAPGSFRASLTKIALAAAAFAVVYSALGIMQYRALLVPHGDTGMYEEHLWNFWHGKGFRSQLDDGRLFLGEHLEVIHLLLSPIYLLYPSLITLIICQAAAAASGAIAIFLIANHVTGRPAAGWWLGAAYLAYSPLQSLCLELSWKTFRPETLAVPILLFALRALEANRYRLFFILIGLTWLAKEEYFLVSAGIGFYLLIRRGRGPLGRREIFLGLGLIAASVILLGIVLGVLIPYFRAGGAPHYTPYFKSLGSSPGEILVTVCTQPAIVIERLFQTKNFEFLALMLLPLGLLPLASPSRFLVSLPIFGYLMLGDLESLTQPYFHFHGPLVPLLFWSAAGGLENAARFASPVRVARGCALLALASGVWNGDAPLSWRFHDPYAGTPRRVEDGMILFEPAGSYWRDRYLPTARSKAFERVYEDIAHDERVAATDYVRTRFTHHAAAHDYPTFRAHVTIDDVDVIVLDKTEGWWGRGATNPDRELLACMKDKSKGPGTALEIRGRPFVVAYHDDYFLVVRRQRE